MAKSIQAHSRRQLSVIAILIVAIATPATLALSYYHITGDPTFRPLALTVERLVARGITVEHIDVQGIVRTDGTREGNLVGSELAQKLNRAFYGKGLNSVFRIQPVENNGPPQIFYHIDQNRLGPFSIRDAPNSVRFAAEAVAINKREKKRAIMEHNW